MSITTTLDNGPASIPANGTQPFQTGGANPGAVTEGVELHVGGLSGANPQAANVVGVIPVNYPNNCAVNGSGTNPLPPSAAPFIDPSIAPFVGQSALVNTNKTLVFGGVCGATSIIVNPA